LHDYLPKADLPQAAFSTYAIMPPMISGLPVLDENSTAGWETIGQMFAQATAEVAGPNATADELRDAWKRVRQAYPRLYGRYDRKEPAADLTANSLRDHVDEVHRRIVEIQAQEPHMTYKAARDLVLNADTRLKNAYTKTGG